MSSRINKNLNYIHMRRSLDLQACFRHYIHNRLIRSLLSCFHRCSHSHRRKPFLWYCLKHLWFLFLLCFRYRCSYYYPFNKVISLCYYIHIVICKYINKCSQKKAIFSFFIRFYSNSQTGTESLAAISYILLVKTIENLLPISTVYHNFSLS